MCVPRPLPQDPDLDLLGARRGPGREPLAMDDAAMRDRIYQFVSSRPPPAQNRILSFTLGAAGSAASPRPCSTMSPVRNTHLSKQSDDQRLISPQIGMSRDGLLSVTSRRGANMDCLTPDCAWPSSRQHLEPNRFIATCARNYSANRRLGERRNHPVSNTVAGQTGGRPRRRASMESPRYVYQLFLLPLSGLSSTAPILLRSSSSFSRSRGNYAVKG